ncbi:unnamed protein product [Rhizopus stolonifer]
MQSSIKVIHNILQQHDACFKEFESLLNENKQLRRDLVQTQELIQQLKEVLTTTAPPVSPAPFVPLAPEDGTEASRYVAAAAKAIPISQSSRQRQRLPKISRNQRSTPAAREAAARNFLPISETQGFSFIYLHLREQYVFIAHSIRPPRDTNLRNPGTHSNNLEEMDTDDSDNLLRSALLTNLNGPSNGDNSARSS